jgi:hypothetical protein
MTISIVDDRPVQESGAGDEFGGVVRIADIRYVFQLIAYLSPLGSSNKAGSQLIV